MTFHFLGYILAYAGGAFCGMVLMAVFSHYVAKKLDSTWEQRMVFDTESIEEQSLRATFDKSMVGKDFEKLILLKLKRIDTIFRDGYVTSPEFEGDFGGDILIRHGDWRCVMQCKKHNYNLEKGEIRGTGVKAVREAIEAVRYYRANCGIVVTNSYFTAAAKSLAMKAGIRLIDYKGLEYLFSGDKDRFLELIPELNTNHAVMSVVSRQVLLDKFNGLSFSKDYPRQCEHRDDKQLCEEQCALVVSGWVESSSCKDAKKNADDGSSYVAEKQYRDAVVAAIGRYCALPENKNYQSEKRNTAEPA